MAITKENIAALYVVLEGRAADGDGLKYWYDITKSNPDMTLDTLAGHMLYASNQNGYFGDNINTMKDFVTKIYENTLGKTGDAIDPEGIDYWVKQAEKVSKDRGEEVKKGEVVNWILYSLTTEEGAKKDPDAYNTLKNKIAISDYVASKITKTPDTPNNEEIQQLRKFLLDTTKDNLEAQKAAVDKYLEDMKASDDEVNVITLTTDTNKTVDGTDKNDLFKASVYVGNGSKQSTFTVLDTIDGKDGDDTLEITTLRNDLAKVDSSGNALTGLKITNGNLGLVNVENVENLKIVSDLDLGESGTKLAISNFDKKVEITSGTNAYVKTSAKDVTIKTGQALELEAASATKVEATAGTTATVTAASATDVKVKAGGNTTVTAAKAKKIDVDSSGTANVSAVAATDVKIKAKDATTVDAKEAQKVDINLNDITKVLTISNPFAKATDVKLSNLKLGAATTFAKATDVELNTVEVGNTLTLDEATNLKVTGSTMTAGITANKIKSVEISSTDAGTNGLTSTVADKLDVTFSGDKAVKLKLTDTALKTLNIHNNAEKEATFNPNTLNALTKLVIDGSGKKLTSDLTSVTTLKDVDATALTGAANLTVKNTTDAVVKLGSGNDRLGLDAATNKMTLDGGEGNDTLAVTSAIAVAANGMLEIANIEALALTDALSGTVDMNNWKAFNKVILEAKSTAGTDKIDNLVDNGTVVISKTALDQNLIVNIKDATSDKANTLNLVIEPKTVNNGLDSSTVYIETTNVETINVESLKAEVETNTTENKIKLKDASLTTLNVTGDAKTTEVALEAAVVKLKDVDASALKGGITIDLTDHSVVGSSIKGAEGDDTITVNKKATIEAGAGADTITFVNGSTVTGGEGKDSFKISGGFDSVNGLDTTDLAFITDLSKGDKILAFGAAVQDKKIVKHESSSNLDFSNNLKNAIATAAASESKVAYFSYTDKNTNEVNTYLVTDDDNTLDTTNTLAIKLSGNVDLSKVAIDGSHNLTIG